MKADYAATPWERLLQLLFPARCLLCGEMVPAGRLFCAGHAKTLPEKPQERQLALPDGKTLRVLSPMEYGGGFRRTLHDFKFRGQRALAKPIARLMAGVATEYHTRFDGVAYAPMYRADRRKRGYDQSRLLAKQLARELGLPLEDALEKVRRTQTQHGLGLKARLDNPQGAYQAKKALNGKSLLLVDDIVTTGSTLRECAQALYAAGAEKVCALCAADTPVPAGRSDTKGK